MLCTGGQCSEKRCQTGGAEYELPTGMSKWLQDRTDDDLTDGKGKIGCALKLSAEILEVDCSTHTHPSDGDVIMWIQIGNLLRPYNGQTKECHLPN